MRAILPAEASETATPHSPTVAGHPSRRLRILIFTTLFPNSVKPLVGNFVLERMRHLDSSVEMMVVAPVPYFPRINLSQRWFEWTRVPRSEVHCGFKVDHPRYVVLPKIGMTIHGMLMFLGSVRQVWKRFRAADFDLIDAHYVYPDGLAAVLLGRLFGKPVVVSARGSDINLFPKFPAIRPLVRHVLKKADAVIAVSQSLKDLIVELGCPDEKITVIGNGVDCVKFSPLPRLDVRRDLGLGSESQIVISVGHLSKLKGFHVLVDAIALLKDRLPRLLLVIVGDGVFRSNLEKQIQQLRLEGRVMLVGARPHEQLSRWYSAADVFCLASSSEGWPNVALEAMACGLPVIATRVGSIPQIVSSPAFGILVDRNAESIAQAVEESLDREWDRRLIIEHARSHSWNNVADRILAVYSDVLAMPRV